MQCIDVYAQKISLQAVITTYTHLNYVASQPNFELGLLAWNQLKVVAKFVTSEIMCVESRAKKVMKCVHFAKHVKCSYSCARIEHTSTMSPVTQTLTYNY